MRGWITYATDDYLSLLEVVEAAVNEFSQYPLHVIKPGTLSNLSYPDRISYKLNALQESPFDQTIWIDADTIPNYFMDDLFCLMDGEDLSYPLCMRHPTDFSHPEIERLVSPKNQPYICACSFMFSRETNSFFQEAIELRHYLKDKVELHSGDEIVINALLWKRTEIRNCDFYCPSFAYFDKYSKGGDADYPCTYHVWHNCKDALKAKMIFKSLKTRKFKRSPLPIVHHIQQ